jgi:hypothetical protein
MSAIQPNKNFDNERQEHTPYSEKKTINIKEVYDRIQKETDAERYRSRGVRNDVAYDKWFKQNK